MTPEFFHSRCQILFFLSQLKEIILCIKFLNPIRETYHRYGGILVQYVLFVTGDALFDFNFQHRLFSLNVGQ